MQEEGAYKICSGCHIKNEFVAEFERTLKAVIYLYNKSKDSLHNVDQEGSESTEGEGYLQPLINNVSLIDNLTYEFITEEEGYTYFALNVDLLKEELLEVGSDADENVE